jgi:outer membrane biosynthesis protein TonB
MSPDDPAPASGKRSEPDDVAFTVRIPRWLVALVVALLSHLAFWRGAALLPEPKPPPQRIAITLQQPPPPAAPTAAESAPAPPARRRAPPPAPSPIVPALPPSDAPPEERVRVPIAERASTTEPPAPAPPARWKEGLLDALAASAPKRPRVPTALAPSAGTLGKVAASDPRLHDEATEQRLQTDFGPFFRRTIEQLRAAWRPDDVIARADFRTTCGHEPRTTYAVAIIDKRGRIVDVDLRRSSGCASLDEEAVATFLRVGEFPYPPSQMFVTPDGAPADTARYPVRFIVTFDGRRQIEWR